MTGRTFFGIEILGGRGVRSADIARLPFAAFWCDSAVRSSQTHDKVTGEWLVRLSDWIAFSELFITTGRHRNMPKPPEVLWFDRDDDEPDQTYFGLDIVREKLIRERDIATLPFYDFWRDSSRGSAMLHDTQTDETFVYLHDWKAFSQLFIETGRHRHIPQQVET